MLDRTKELIKQLVKLADENKQPRYVVLLSAPFLMRYGDAVPVLHRLALLVAMNLAILPFYWADVVSDKVAVSYLIISITVAALGVIFLDILYASKDSAFPDSVKGMARFTCPDKNPRHKYAELRKTALQFLKLKK